MDDTIFDRLGTSLARTGSRLALGTLLAAAGTALGLAVDSGGSLRGAQAVRSCDFEQVWFVAADM